MNIRTKNIRNVDYLTIAVFLVLAVFGWMNIFSSAYTNEEVAVFNFSTRYGKQMLWFGVALVMAIVLFFIESHIISFFSYYVYGLIMLLLIAVLLFGTTVNESRSWIELFGLRIQPAEFAKLGTALALAKYISRGKFSFNKYRDFIIASALIVLPALLILLQNDTGSAIVFSAFLLVFFREGLHYLFLALIFLAVLLFILSFYLPSTVLMLIIVFLSFFFYSYYSGNPGAILLLLALFVFVGLLLLIPVVIYFIKIPLEYVIVTAGFIASTVYMVIDLRHRIYTVAIIFLIYIAAVLFVFSVDYLFQNILNDYQQDRIEVFLGLLEDEKGIGYNVNQSKIAIGSGGFNGKGYLQGTQTKFDFVPEQDTDFIFCTVGEEWGFLGSSLMIILFIILIYRLIIMAERQRSRFSRVFGYSVACIFFFHFGVNIAMTIGLAPVIGIPLPFISYGGSSLWAFTLLLFIMLRLDMKSQELI
ncbi:MAG: rod shape-determining protein RodA [Bacteroidota bacterium]|nr:rod shape-determining protein RodA [Bacteroidota bacterium]